MLKRILSLAGVLACMFGVSQRANAGCWDYEVVGEQKCTGSGGCEGVYLQQVCTFGCVSGECFNNGGSGECCGHIYYSPVIYGDGGDCSDEGCNLVARRSPEGAALAPAPISKAPPLAEHFPRLLLIPDRCAHTYAIIVQENPRIGGM